MRINLCVKKQQNSQSWTHVQIVERYRILLFNKAPPPPPPSKFVFFKLSHNDEFLSSDIVLWLIRKVCGEFKRFLKNFKFFRIFFFCARNLAVEMGVNLLSAPYHMKKKWKNGIFLWKTCTFLPRFWLRKKFNFFINENFGQFLSKQAVYEFFTMKTRFCGFSRNFSSKKLIFFKISFFRLFRIFWPKIDIFSKFSRFSKIFNLRHKDEFLSYEIVFWLIRKFRKFFFRKNIFSNFCNFFMLFSLCFW